MNDIYYVYMYMRGNGTPYYVGKGSGNRAWSKSKRIIIPSNKNSIIIVAKNLYEHEAFLLEKILIKQYGRKDVGTGILRNLTDGGDGITGYDLVHKKYDERYGEAKAMTIKKQKSTSMLGKNKGEKSGRWGKPPANLGTNLSEERKNQLSIDRTGKNNPRYDHTVYCWKNITSEETFYLTRQEFIKKFNADAPSICGLVKKKQTSVNGFMIVW